MRGIPAGIQHSKDPDVWDPPSPKQIPKKTAVKKAVMNNNSGSYNKKRDYEKPWKVKKDDSKKTFLQNKYPDGNGPDSTLISLIEN